MCVINGFVIGKGRQITHLLFIDGTTGLCLADAYEVHIIIVQLL